MFEEDTYYYANISSNVININKVSKETASCEKRFSTSELAQEYLDNNAPKYSLNDIEVAYLAGSPVWDKIVKQLINLKK